MVRSVRPSVFARWLLAGGTLLVSSSVAWATLYAYEPFNYSNPLAINGQNGGSGWSNAWDEPGPTGGDPNDTVADVVALGSLGSSKGVNTLGNRLYTGGKYDYATRSLSTSLGSPGTVWVSFLLRRDVAGNPADGNDYGGLAFGENGTGTPLFIGRDEVTGMYTLSDMSGSNNHPSSVPETLGATVMLVARMTFTTGNDTVDLFLDPTPGITPTTPITTKSDTNLGTFQQMNVMTGSSANWSIDEIRVGSGYSDVTPTPEPGTIGALALVGLMALGRRRR